MRLQPRRDRDRDEDRVPSRTPATQQSGWATAATSSAGRSCAVECEEGARCVIAGARSGPRTATRAALGERQHALLKPKWKSQRTIHLEQLDTKARHGKLRAKETATRPHPRRARLACGIRHQRSATCDHNVTTSLGGATGRDGGRTDGRAQSESSAVCMMCTMCMMCI